MFIKIMYLTKNFMTCSTAVSASQRTQSVPIRKTSRNTLCLLWKVLEA